MINGEVRNSYFEILAFNVNVSYIREDNNLAFNSELHMASQ